MGSLFSAALFPRNAVQQVLVLSNRKKGHQIALFATPGSGRGTSHQGTIAAFAVDAFARAVHQSQCDSTAKSQSGFAKSALAALN
mmetsp:Transcript_86506/g.166526  ORF Transcript_86506/g.166526 Transcript_86506/m.166526 type:complete len:85 (+) Transcript_86506:94-348(+)